MGRRRGQRVRIEVSYAILAAVLRRLEGLQGEERVPGAGLWVRVAWIEEEECRN